MIFQRLDHERDGLFRLSFELYEQSFPLHERRRAESQKALLSNPAYYYEAILEDEDLAGLICYWRSGPFAYIEHFAVSPELRGRALGSRALQEFGRRHGRVILEIDPPVDPISLRRENFYLRSGFKRNPYSHRHPAYRKNFSPHELVIMSFPREISQTEYHDFNVYLNNVVMADAEK